MLTIHLTERTIVEIEATKAGIIGERVEIRDYDWPREGDLSEPLPLDHELIEEADGTRYVRSYIVTVKGEDDA